MIWKISENKELEDMLVRDHNEVKEYMSKNNTKACFSPNFKDCKRIGFGLHTTQGLQA